MLMNFKVVMGYQIDNIGLSDHLDKGNEYIVLRGIPDHSSGGEVVELLIINPAAFKVETHWVSYKTWTSLKEKPFEITEVLT